ncbi:murein L,D-transpeptidase family protein [uncultured Roseibium sp.]|uniref:L,D-transpeptidase family protein n=1 Tax=uncultured Roseibium sp. TaxID=1936171 RepID=UPI0025920D25|nr:murein L,D-transpeptidase family protein [uncultured Roseibium sp.]
MAHWQNPKATFSRLTQISYRRARNLGGALLVAGVLAGCQADELGYGPKAQRPVSSEIKRKITDLNMSRTSPILIRIFKEENTLEVWKEKRNGRFALLEEFEICKWSGKLGPKFKEGDRQAPEGFYEITPGLMNPNSSYHLAFNLGFPNSYDRSHGRTGSHLMVHGACSSRGCYAMTDAQVQDIYALARDSFKGGQRSFQVQAYPFEMTPENMAKHRDSEHMEFWRMLKTGYDHFELTQVPPKVSVCEKKYVFDATPLVEGIPFRASAKCPDYQVSPRLQQLVSKKQSQDDKKYEQIVARLDAREERQKRWEERQTKIANVIGGGTQADEADPASTAETQTVSTPAAPGAITPKPETGDTSVETAFAPSVAKPSTTSSFFKRWVPFGNKAEDDTPSPEVGEISTELVPASKP